jgi:hypothetical protein
MTVNREKRFFCEKTKISSLAMAATEGNGPDKFFIRAAAG